MVREELVRKEGNWQNLRSCRWVQLLRKGIGEAALANFDPIISIAIRISFGLMERHCSDGGRKSQFGAINPWTGGRRKECSGDISPNPSSYILPRPKYWRDSKSIPVVAAVGIKQLILEYLCSEPPSIALQRPSSRNSSNNPRRGLHPSYSHHCWHGHHYLIGLLSQKILTFLPDFSSKTVISRVNVILINFIFILIKTLCLLLILIDNLRSISTICSSFPTSISSS